MIGVLHGGSDPPREGDVLVISFVHCLNRICWECLLMKLVSGSRGRLAWILLISRGQLESNNNAETTRKQS